MADRTIMDAVDIKTGDRIYFRGSAQITLMADGTTLDDCMKDTKTRLEPIGNLNVSAVESDGVPSSTKSFVTLKQFENDIQEIEQLLDEIIGNGDTSQTPTYTQYEVNRVTSTNSSQIYISFKINNIQYSAEEGMTWEQWINSIYNIDFRSILSINAMEGNINLSDQIIPGHLYNYTHGVFLVTADGSFIDSASWTSDMGATGVAVINDTISLVVAPTGWASRTAWGDYSYPYWGPSVLLSTVSKAETETTAMSRFSGRRDTIEMLKYKEESGQNFPAAEYCNEYSSGCMGKGNWHLPSGGEMCELQGARTNINNILSVIGGTSLSANYVISSTQYSYNSNVRQMYGSYEWSTGVPRLSSMNKNGDNYYHVRPIITF